MGTGHGNSRYDSGSRKSLKPDTAKQVHRLSSICAPLTGQAAPRYHAVAEEGVGTEGAATVRRMTGTAAALTSDLPLPDLGDKRAAIPGCHQCASLEQFRRLWASSLAHTHGVRLVGKRLGAWLAKMDVLVELVEAPLAGTLGCLPARDIGDTGPGRINVVLMRRRLVPPSRFPAPQ